MTQWFTMQTIRKNVAELPERWFYGFAASDEHKRHWRKSPGQNGRLVFSVADVLKAIDDKFGGLTDGEDVKGGEE